MSLEGLAPGILGPAFVAGLVVLMTHIPLGYEVLRRGIIFIDIAVAQIAGLGVVIAYTLGWDEHGIEAQIAAVISALTGAWVLSKLEKKYGDHQEVGDAYCGLGRLEGMKNNLALSREYYDKAAASYRKTGDYFKDAHDCGLAEFYYL